MKRYITIAMIISTLVACTKESDFIEDNTDPTGAGSRPVSTNTLYDVGRAGNPALNAGSYAPGSEAKTELQFFSDSPIKEINLYSTINTVKTLEATIPYAPAFSKFKGNDTLLVTYTVPALPAGTSIKLDYEIMNENTLSVTRTATMRRVRSFRGMR